MIIADNLWERGSEIYHSDATLHVLFGILWEVNTRMQAKGMRRMELNPFSK